MALNTVVTSKATAGQVNQSLLGNLVFVTVSELKVHKQDLVTLFTNSGLSLQKYQPGDIRPSDAMRRATSLIKNKRLGISYNGANVNAVLDVTEQQETALTIRHIGRKVVDEKGRKVCYDQLTSFFYDKQNNSLTFDPVDPLFCTEYAYDQLFSEVIATYNEWCQYHTKDTVRNIINKVVQSLMPTPIKTTPDDDAIAKFIPVTYEYELKALKQVIGDLGPYHTAGAVSGCQLIELYDSEANNSMIADAVKGDIKGRVQNLVGELTEILNNKGSIPVEQAQRFARQLVQMKNETTEYAGILSVSMDVLERQIATALSRIEGFTPVS